MEQIVNLHIERLPEGVYLATSDDVAGLVAQPGAQEHTRLKEVSDSFDYPLVVSG